MYVLYLLFFFYFCLKTKLEIHLARSSTTSKGCDSLKKKKNVEMKKYWIQNAKNEEQIICNNP